MTRTHKLVAYKTINDAINDCDDFASKLKSYFGGEFKDTQTKDDGNLSFFYNKKFGLFKVVQIDLRIPKAYKNTNPRLIPMGEREKVMLQSYFAFLDSNFKVIPKPVNDDWAGVCWNDLIEGTKKTLKI